MTPVEAIRPTNESEQVIIGLDRESTDSVARGGVPSQYQETWEQASKMLSKGDSVAIDFRGNYQDARNLRSGLKDRYKVDFDAGLVNFKIGTRIIEESKKIHVVLLYKR